MKTANPAPTLFDESPPPAARAAIKTEPAELVRASEAVALAAPTPSTGQSGMMALAQMEQGLKVLERAHKILLQIRRSAIGLTGPRDWVAMKGKGAADSETVCMLTNSGAHRVKNFFQIQVEPVQPTGTGGEFEPTEEHGEEGELQLSGYCVAKSFLTGEVVHVTGSRSSSEEFVGRGVIRSTTDLVAKGDLKESVSSLLFTKAVRQLAGMKSVPIAELEEAGLSLAQMTKGSGFGSASERAASGVTDDSVKADRKKLGDEVLSCVAGDKDAARKLLKEITANKAKGFDGFDSIERLTKEWQVRNARTRLREHEVFGDKAQGGNGGAA